MQLYQKKRETLRITIRKEQQQEQFAKKRKTFKSEEDSLITLKYMNQNLIQTIKGNQDLQPIDLDNLIKQMHSRQFAWQYQTPSSCEVQYEILWILVNLTYIVDHIELRDFQLIDTLILPSLQEISLELLINLWYQGWGSYKENSKIIEFLKCISVESIRSLTESRLKLILKATKNYLQSFTDDSLTDFSKNLGLQIIQHGINNLYYLALQNIYLAVHKQKVVTHLNEIVTAVCKTFQEEDLRTIGLQILIEAKQKSGIEFYFCQGLLQFIKYQDCRVYKSFLFLGEIFNTLEYILFILHFSVNLQIFFEDEEYIQRVVEEYQLPLLHTLIGNCNELQIQQLMQYDVYNRLLDQLKEQEIEIDQILMILESIHNIVKVYSVQSFNYDYPITISQLALSKNQDIQEISNQILEYFEQEGLY